MIAWINGKLIDETEKKDITDDNGLFETVRVDGGKALCLDMHLERMRNSAHSLSLKINWSDEQISSAVKDIIKENALTLSALRITLTDYMQIESFPLRYTEEDYSKGFRIEIIEKRREGSPEKYFHKTLANRKENLLVKKQMSEKGLDEGIWLNEKDEVCEGIFSNIFIVDKNGIMATPSVSCGLLSGITRKRILNEGLSQNYKIGRRTLHIDEILSAREVFLTNALTLAMPVVECAGHIIGNGKPGEITLRMKEALEKNFIKSF